jgi:cardiolipin synthase
LAAYCELVWSGFSKKRKEQKQLALKTEYFSNGSYNDRVRMRRNDWIRRKNEISSTYIDLFRLAQQDIIIICSYFLPGKIIRRVLTAAAKRGVRIRVVIAGPSDVMLAKHAERWLYDWLLRHNILLYEYQPAVLHAKVAVADRQLLTIGSYNINNLSAYASIELNLDVKAERLVAQAVDEFESIIQNDCLPITVSNHLRSRNPVIQLVRWGSYQGIRLVFYLFTFFFRQRGNEKRTILY